MVVKYLVLVAFSSLIFLAMMSFVQANHFSVCSPGCNTTIVWWNDTVNVTGSNGADASVTVRLDGTTACTTTVVVGGSWNCTFTAPREVGSYNISVTVGSTTDDSTLIVRPNYGEEPTGTASRFVLETPLAMQEPSSEIRTLLTRLTVSQGPPS